jgi:hypothetical protein
MEGRVLRAIKHPFPIYISAPFLILLYMLKASQAAQVIFDPAPIQITDKYGRTVIQVITEALYHYSIVIYSALV